MKTTLRAIALTSVVPALFAISTLSKNKPVAMDKTVAILNRSTVPGPVPACNPLTQTCPNIRER